MCSLVALNDAQLKEICRWSGKLQAAKVKFWKTIWLA